MDVAISGCERPDRSRAVGVVARRRSSGAAIPARRRHRRATRSVGIPTRVASMRPRSKGSTRSCTSRARASASSAGPTSRSAASATAACAAPRCSRPRSRAASASRACSCRARRSGTTATAATRCSPRRARRATTSSPRSASRGKRRPQPATEAGVRTVLTRTGIVLDAHGGALKRMLLPFKLGIGGRQGSGKQWMSWIALADEVGAIRAAIENDALQRSGQPRRAEPGHQRRVRGARSAGCCTGRRSCRRRCSR